MVGGDLPARSKCNKISAHNGFYSCTYCLFQGVSCAHHRHVLYPYVDFKQIRPPPRTREHIAHCVEQIKQSNTKDFRIYGVYGQSPLSALISIPVQSTLDYFHLALEIHLVFLLSQWKQIIPKPVHAEVSNFLLKIKYPHSFNRRPYDFVSSDKWKASQLRVFLLYAALPLTVRFLPSNHQSLFSLFFIYIRTLRFFKTRQDIQEMQLYVDEYLTQFPMVFHRCNELYSVHALLHLVEQCFSFGGLAYHSMFASESALHHFSKLAHGTISRGAQIAYWHCVNRQLDTLDAPPTPNLFYQKFFLKDRFVDLDIWMKFRSVFREVFLEKFHAEVPATFCISSRFQSGFYLYHSLAYSKRHSTASHRVCVDNRRCSFSRCFGEIIFFFEYNGHMYFFFKRLLCDGKPFSSFIDETNRIKSWSSRINEYFSLVNFRSSSLCIVSCTLLRHKTIFIPFLKNFFLCTEIEHELEHD